MEMMQRFTMKIVDVMKQENLYASQGGPIILSQIENEYGNVDSGYGPGAKPYINWCASMAIAQDTGTPWVMCQQADAPNPIINICNGFYCDQFTPNSNNKPKIWTSLEWMVVVIEEVDSFIFRPHIGLQAKYQAIKWICPTAPTRPVAVFGGFACTAWFDVEELSQEGSDDTEGMDASATHIANLLLTEPADIKVGVGGFSLGAAMALYSATCSVQGRFRNGNPFPVNISAVVGLSGWLPCSRSLRSKVESSQNAIQRAASLTILMCHGNEDDEVIYKHGEKSAEIMRSSGFRNLTFKPYNGLGHYTIPEEMDDVCRWLTSRLGLVDGPANERGNHLNLFF